MKIQYTAHRHDSKIGTIEDVRDDFARQLIATGCAVAAPEEAQVEENPVPAAPAEAPPSPAETTDVATTPTEPSPVDEVNKVVRAPRTK